MLQFVLGRAGSGKTTEIHNRIKNASQSGVENIILLVPEQYSFETEKQMLRLLGNGFMGKIEVLGFTRMCETVGHIYGGLAGIHIDDAMRQILMGRAVKNSASQLSSFKRYSKTPEFVSQAVDIISEFKQAGVSAGDILKVCEKVEIAGLGAKLKDIALIYACYDNLLKGIYIDPLDDLEILYKTAEKHSFFKGKTIFIDQFKGFTGIQMKLIKLMLLQSQNVTISLCCNGLEDKMGGAGVFSNIIASANRLIEFAKSNNIKVVAPYILQDSYAASKVLLSLEGLLSGEADGETVNDESVNLGIFSSPDKEIQFVFRNIRRLVREKGYLFSDFVVIARNIEKYERLIETASKKFDVPCFLDKRKAVIYSPVARLVLSALKSASSLEGEEVLSFLKSNLLGLTVEEVSLLEEYAYVWDIKGEDWCKKWDMNPEGFSQRKGDTTHQAVLEKLDKLNKLRETIIIPLLKLRGCLSSGCKGIGEGVFNLLLHFGVDRRVKQYCEELVEVGNIDQADFIMDSWDVVIGVLDSMVRCYNDEEISVKEYINMLEISFTGATIGAIPRTLDEVTCGSADRIRPGRPKVCFVVGMNMGEFPSSVTDGGLLLRSDRIVLERAGLEISDRFRSFAVDESFLVYTSLTCAFEKVYALCHLHSSEGSVAELSNTFLKIQKHIKGSLISDENEYLPETEEDAFSVFAESYNSGSEISAVLDKYFSDSEKFSKRCEAVKNIKLNTKHSISKEACSKIFSDDIYLSASKIENYNSCAFSYFCRYILNINPIQKANLDSRQRGTIVHFVLENIIKEFGKLVGSTDLSVLYGAVDRYMEEFLMQIDGYNYLKQPRFEFLYNAIAKTVKYVVAHISKEFANNDFEPSYVEMHISKGGDVPELRIEFDEGKSVNITGFIDRVDVFNNSEDGNNYVRIVDYKTYSKTFYLAEVLYGLNLQMLVYLYALKVNGDKIFNNFSPAGILYQHSKRTMTEEGKSADGSLKMNGMLVDNNTVLQAMDKAQTGDFVPVKTGRARMGDPIISSEDFEEVFAFVEHIIKKTAKKITSGEFNVDPLDGHSSACQYCEMASVCGIEPDFPRRCIEKFSNREIIDLMREVQNNGN